MGTLALDGSPLVYTPAAALQRSGTVLPCLVQADEVASPRYLNPDQDELLQLDTGDSYVQVGGIWIPRKGTHRRVESTELRREMDERAAATLLQIIEQPVK